MRLDQIFLCRAPDPRVFRVLPKTAWVPQGPRIVGSSHPAIPVPDTFHTMHVGVNNTDEIYSVVAPMTEFDWIAEDKLYVPEGPTLDNEGNLYFSPLINEEGVPLVSLDRETGELRYYAEGQEESIAVTVVGPDGGFYMANSPVRRAIARAMFPKVVPPLSGGISRYKPIRLELLIRDAACAGAARVDNSLKFPSSIEEDIRSLQVLIDQSQNALPKVKDQNLSAGDQVKISKLLLNAEANLSQPDLEVAGQALGRICGTFE